MKKTYSALRKQLYRGNMGVFTVEIAAILLLMAVNLGVSWLLQQVIDVVAGIDTGFSILQLALMAAAMVAAVALGLLIRSSSKPRFFERAMLQYKSYAFSQLTKKSLAAFSGEQTAVYLSALSNDAASIETNYLEKLFALIADCVLALGALALMLYYSPLLMLIAIAFSALPLAAALLTGGKLAAADRRVSEQNKNFMAQLDDLLSGFSVIKSFQAESEAEALFAKANQAAEHEKRGRRKISILVSLFTNTGNIASQLGIFLAAAVLSKRGFGVTPGMVVVFVQLVGLLAMPFQEIPEALANRNAAHALMEKLAGALEENMTDTGVELASGLTGPIEVRGVRFGYEPGKEVLHGVSATFEPGRSYAVVGASGSGKSTLLSLLQGAYKNYSGDVLINGTQLKEASAESVFSLVSSIGQSVFIFNASIRDNITMFRDFDPQAVDRAIEGAGLSQLIAARGEDYLCGENGCNLSGGERQRISIARCLLRKTPVLLADEATAALDRESAGHVCNSILSLKELTRIVVTHALDAPLLRRYDRILAFKDGRVAEEGTFDELMEKKGYFYSLYTLNT